VRVRRLGSAVFAAGLALLAVPNPTCAKIVAGNSIEWLCERERHIAIVRVPFPADRERPKGDLGYSNVQGRVVAVLKGSPSREIVIDCWNGVRVAPGQTRDVLTFSDDSLRSQYAIAFGDSESCVGGDAITRDCRVLGSRRAILPAVLERLQRMAREGRAGIPAESADGARFLTLEVPEGSDAFWKLYSGSTVLIHVPADSEYKSRWLRDIKSTDVRRRAAAAALLSKYPGPETVRLLTELLQDPGVDSVTYYGSNGSPRRTETFRAVACVACQSLRELGVTVECPGSCPFESYFAPAVEDFRLRAR
jgi:hypothetical protein